METLAFFCWLFLLRSDLSCFKGTCDYYEAVFMSKAVTSVISITGILLNVDLSYVCV